MPRKDLEHYWGDRLDERINRNANLTISEAEKEIAKIYEYESNEISNAILEVFAKIEVDKDSDEGIMINDLYRNQRYWDLWNYIDKRLKSLGKQQLQITESALIETYEMTKEVVGEHVEARTTSFLIPTAIDAKQIVHQVWCLDGKEFSDRIWKDKGLLKARLNEALSRCLVQGKSPWASSQVLKEQMLSSDYNAFRIVRTEAKHLQNKGKVDKFTEMGYTHGIYQGKHCCPKCQKNNGKIFTLKELESMIPVHPNCTCSFRLVTK